MMAAKKAKMAEEEAQAKMMTAEKKAMMVKNPMVGGAPMMAKKTIVENASMASNLTTLVAAVKQAQLVETLSGPGPFTVFAPTDAAFSLLPADVTSSLMMDENRADLQKVLTAHVVAGNVTSADLMMRIKENNGSYTATTVSGDALTFFMSDGKVKVADENGMVATVTTADVMQSNGVVHVVNSVLVPK
ncbi:fasciclin domain-containing protein [Robiginitomaculum antarcticum]|uniref:fasciclin domain-containing protein n=1 Tax=Robiginitomaculum antarcticum TaxID=437507 RepID=UPI00389A74F6